MPKILIIADDLTGAADCGAAFAQCGFITKVLLAGTGALGLPTAEARDADVLALDVDTRCMNPADAAQTVAQIVRVWDQPPIGDPRLLFKKMDSTLRGNVAAELAAALRARRESLGDTVCILLATAFPACGRTTVDGRQFVNGKPLADSGVWRRENLNPQEKIATLLAQAGLSSGGLGLAQIRAGARTLERAMRNMANETDTVICDAETDDDLEAIARSGLLLDRRTVWAGSAGLARQLAKVELPPRPGPQSLRVHGPALFVVGSPAEASRQQSGELANSNISVFALRPSDLDGDSQRHATEISARLRDGHDVLIHFDSGQAALANHGRELVQALARALAPCRNNVGTLFATGGETARAILDAWRIPQFRLLGEIEPGLPYGIAHCGGRELLILTKAGAFGSRQTLLRCREFIHSVTAPTSRTLEVKPTHMHQPIIAITMGDAAGVGPEIIVKSLCHKDVYDLCRPLVIGDAERLRLADRICATGLDIRSIATAEIDTGEYQPGIVLCVDLKLIPRDLPWGQLSAQAGEGAYQFLAVAAQLAMDAKVAAICTAPLNKEALHAAGHRFPGHTELLAHLTGTPEVSMMLTTPKLNVLHVTTHIGLIDAIRKIEPGLVERTVSRGHAALVKSGITNPRIGVCGINPHAGENGLFGYGEEEQKIVPAIDACRRKGWNVEGPLPADTLFYRAQRGDFDLVIAMYHDQGHGPVKVLGLESGVNITIGLPVVRTSVDHGTAFDIAGSGRADERSLLEAIRQAVQLAPNSSPGTNTP
jgi:4-hydroxythreonine-4-phosphate dehydrogenase